MNSLERFYKTIAYEPVDRPACWMGDPTPEEAKKLCEYYGVANTSELKKVVWYPKKDVVRDTGIVVVALVASGVVIGLLDFAFVNLIRLLG